MKRNSLLLSLATAVLLAAPPIARGQSFGKNKVQYENWTWYYLETEHFDVYFYEGAEELARFAAVEAERSLAAVERDFHYEVTKRIPLIVYKSHNDFQSTNVTGGLLPEGVGGFTEFLKHRVVVPFEADYAQFRHVIHHELVHAVMFDMLYGRSLASIIRGQGQLSLPLWFSEGLAEYISTGWDTKSDMFIRDAVLNGNLPPLDQLGGYFAYKGGQSLFRYLGDKYGREKVGEFLGKVRAYRNLDRAAERTVGRDLEELDREWKKAVRREYWPDIADRDEPAETARRITDHTELGNYYNTSPAVSPDGSRIAFLTDRNYYADVFVRSTIDGSKARRVVKGNRTGQFEELHWLRPGLSWSPDGTRITLAAKAGQRDHLFVVDADDGEVRREFDFMLDGIFSPSWSPVGDRIAFVGMKDGHSDIYEADLTSGDLYQVTDDVFSDLDPSWDPTGEKIVFVSDRGDATGKGEASGAALPMWKRDYETKDLYLIDRYGTNLVRVTDDPYREETPVFASDGRRLLYVSDRNGCFNVFVHDLRDGRSWPITNVLTGVFDLSLTRDDEKLVFAALFDGGWDIYEMVNPLSVEPGEITLEPTIFRRQQEEALAEDAPPAGRAEPDVGSPQEVRQEGVDLSHFVITPESVLELARRAREHHGAVGEVLASGVEVDSTDGGGPGPGEGLVVVDEEPEDEEGGFRIRRYSPRFSPDIVYGAAAYSQYYGVIGASQIAISDILGNHQIFLASNLYFDLANSDFFASYFYLPNRIDYGIAGFHNAFLWISEDRDFVDQAYREAGRPTGADWVLFRDRIYGFQIATRRPMDRFRRLEADLGLVFIDRDFLDLGAPTRRRRLLQPSFAYVTDTALWGLTGPMGGGMSRYSISASPKLFREQLEFVTLEADIRRYLLFAKEYAFAFRAFAGASYGADPQRFFVGGMQNWLNRDPVEGIRVESLDDLYFSSYVMPLRGADYYARSGTRAALANIEFRFPLLRYLSMGFPLPITLGNIRGAIFCDLGSAWDEGSDWRLFTRTPTGERVLDDLSLGYGMGARWNLGFFILKLDVGWSQDFAHRPRARWYLTLGPEF